MSALALVHDNPTIGINDTHGPGSITEMSNADLVSAVVGMFNKIARNMPYIRELKRRFDTLPEGAVIAGCATWTAFCKNVLGTSAAYIRVAEKRERDAARDAEAPAAREPETEPTQNEPELADPLVKKLELVFGEGQVDVKETVITRFGHHAVCPQHRYGRIKVSLLMTHREAEEMYTIISAAIKGSTRKDVEPAPEKRVLRVGDFFIGELKQTSGCTWQGQYLQQIVRVNKKGMPITQVWSGIWYATERQPTVTSAVVLTPEEVKKYYPQNAFENAPAGDNPSAARIYSLSHARHE